MPWLLTMSGRDRDEPHRVATPLELFFDLCFVVAVALASSELHHEVSAGHVTEGLTDYIAVFFAVWWAWMGFTWFASAYDTDDVVYRIQTGVQMVGVLVLAAGVPRAFQSDDYSVMTAGYVVMRLAMVSQWLRVAHGDAATRRTALRYAAGITAVQIGWVARLWAPDELLAPLFAVLVACELAIPFWGQGAGRTSWHPHHIAERYGLFTIIMLGESILSITIAFQQALDAGNDNPGLWGLALSGVVIVICMWWLYFHEPGDHRLRTLRRGFGWGYGHYVVFASTAAVGAAIAVGVDYKTDHSELSRYQAAFALAVPLAIFVLSVWFIVLLDRDVQTLVYPAGAGVILLCALLPFAAELMAGVMIVLIALTVIIHDGPAHDPSHGASTTGS